MKVRITLEADLDENALLVYPPDDEACASLNLWSYLREGWILKPLQNRARREIQKNRGEVDTVTYDALCRHDEVEIGMGKQFDRNCKIEFLP